jgi:hypothetical protein
MRANLSSSAESFKTASPPKRISTVKLINSVREGRCPDVGGTETRRIGAHQVYIYTHIKGYLIRRYLESQAWSSINGIREVD